MEKSAFRQALGAFMTGVTIVTTLDEEGAPWGVTANSFTSVSLDPPLILVCLGKGGRAFPSLAAAERFAISILAREQRDLATHFASTAENRFTGVAWQRTDGGGAILPGCAAWLDCRRRERIDAGDHAILLGEVVAFGSEPREPLGYCRGRFVTPRSVAELSGEPVDA